MRPVRFAVPALAAAALATACGEAPEERAQVGEEERRIGAGQHDALLAQFGGAYQGPEAAYFRALGEKVAAAAGLEGDCTFTLVNTDVVNAFAVPGCYIYLTRGMMSIVNSEAELVSVIGHELGHILEDHSEQQQQRSLLRQLGVLAVALATESETLTRIAGGAAQLFTFRYSRTHEHEADVHAVRSLIAAGYDPYEAADMLEALGRHEKFQQGGEDHHAIPEWGRTHPLTRARVERVRKAAAEAGARGAQPAQAQRFLGEVDGLLYGDDPEQGFVLGRRFAHPGMRLAFEVPQGFRLTNTPRAVLIEGPDGVRGEFAGGGAAADLEAYVQRLVEEVFGGAPDLRRATRTTVNGVPALILPLALRTQQGDVEALVAAYGGPGGAAYHFLLVAPPGQAMPAGVEALVGSFTPISAEEAARLRPRVIDVVAVGAGDSLQSLAAQMATERPLEHFLMLNGRSPDEPLRPGEQVKLVRFAD